MLLVLEVEYLALAYLTNDTLAPIGMGSHVTMGSTSHSDTINAAVEVWLMMVPIDLDIWILGSKLVKLFG